MIKLSKEHWIIWRTVKPDIFNRLFDTTKRRLKPGIFIEAICKQITCLKLYKKFHTVILNGWK